MKALICVTQGVNPWIEVDGGVTPANAYQLIDAGANALVAGSAVFGAKSYKDGELICYLNLLNCNLFWLVFHWILCGVWHIKTSVGSSGG